MSREFNGQFDRSLGHSILILHTAITLGFVAQACFAVDALLWW